MESLQLVGMISIIMAVVCIMAGALAAGLGEASIARQAMQAIAQQPDEAGEISKTLVISMAIVESSAIYCFVVSMILIFSNPFWNTLVAKF